MTKKIIIGVVSVLFLTFVGCFIGINWKGLKTLMSGAQIYTKDQMEESYNQGYEDANTNEDTYITQLDYYRNLVEDNELELTNYKNQVTNLTNSNNNYANQVNSLNQTIQTNEETISNLQSLIDTNDTTVAELETEIANYESQINVLEKEITALQTENSNKTAEIQNKQNQVASLNNQVNSLQNLVNQLNATNETNLATISTLNNQIQSLNSQISDLKLQINNNNTNVADLNNKIADLEKSVAYYEQYISNLETETQVVATFEFDGAVYNVQILNKGAYASVVAPTSTDYIVFNGWKVNDEIVDLNNYAINENTKFVADVTYNFDVKFSVDNAITESQIVVKDTFAVAPTSPTKTGYSFDGWTVDGVNIVDVSSYTITANTTFTAVFTKMYTVTFVYEDETISTQSIKNGYYAENVTVENTTYKVFNGWLVNGTTVDIATYKISADTVFVADVTYKYNVTFTVDGETYDTQIVTANNYALNPTAPTKEDYIFKGWSIDGINFVDISTYSISADILFTAVFEEDIAGLYVDGVRTVTWQEMIDNNWLSMSNGTLLKGSAHSRTNFVGDLIISSDVKYITSSSEGSSSISSSYGVFSSCSSLTSVVIPDSVICVGPHSSSFCSGLTNIQFGQGVKTIGYSAFRRCKSLTKVIIPDSVTTLSSSVFEECSVLADVYIGSSVVSLKSRVFASCYVLEELVIPDSVTSISSDAFYSSTKLKTITFGSGIKSLSSDSILYSLNKAVVHSVYMYNNMTSSSGWSGKVTYKVVYVLKSIVDDSSNTNTYLNNTANYTKTEDGDYYIYTKVA